jgi:hypothetical protein
MKKNAAKIEAHSPLTDLHIQSLEPLISLLAIHAAETDFAAASAKQKSEKASDDKD